MPSCQATNITRRETENRATVGISTGKAAADRRGSCVTGECPARARGNTLACPFVSRLEDFAAPCARATPRLLRLVVNPFA